MITALTIYGAVKLHKRQKARKERKRLELEQAAANATAHYCPGLQFTVQDPSNELLSADKRPLTTEQQALFSRFSSEMKKDGAGCIAADDDDDDEAEVDDELDEEPPSYESATGTWVRQQRQHQQQEHQQEKEGQLSPKKYQMINESSGLQRDQSGTSSSRGFPLLPPQEKQLPLVVEMPIRSKPSQISTHRLHHQTQHTPATTFTAAVTPTATVVELPSPQSRSRSRDVMAETSRLQQQQPQLPGVKPMDAVESYASSRAARRAERPTAPAVVETKSRAVRIAEMLPNRIPAAELAAGTW